MKKYDVAAYVWPAYTGKEPRAYQFWDEMNGEWQTVKTAKAKYDGHQWPRKPLWGYVDEADPEVMEMQIKEAVNHGINVFIYDWYWYDDRPFLEQCLNDGFLKAKNTLDMKFCLMWANHDANTSWDKRLSDYRPFIKIWDGKVNFNQFKIIVKRIIENYFKKENYYKCGNKPVFMIYHKENLINGLGGVEKTKKALEYFRQEVKKAGFEDLHLVYILTENDSNLSGVDNSNDDKPYEVIEKLGFDGATHYQMAHFTSVNRDYNEIIPDCVKEWERVSAAIKAPYYPHVSMGWDNNPRFNKLMKNVVKNNTPENVEKMLKEVKKFMDNSSLELPLVTVNSWNEWTESSYLQPDDLYGYGYLDAFKKVFKDEK